LAKGPRLDELILEVRGQKVMLDFDLARVYGVETKALNRAVKRNADRFPKDFMFQISSREWENLRYQIGTLKTGRGQHRKYLPYAFTEHGAINGCQRP
jgi:ORF6N domain